MIHKTCQCRGITYCSDFKIKILLFFLFQSVELVRVTQRSTNCFQRIKEDLYKHGGFLDNTSLGTTWLLRTALQ